MKIVYTLQDLRALGVETVARTALIGKGRNRRAFPADASGVVINFDRVSAEEKLKYGALIASLEKRHAKLQGDPAPEPEAPKPVAKKVTVRKKAAAKAE